MANLSAAQHYRQTTIGQTLIDTLDGLVQEHRLEPQLYSAVLRHFDRIIADVFRENVRLQRKQMKFKARCQTYRFFDDRWFWLLTRASLKTDGGRRFESEHVKVYAVAADPKNTADSEEETKLHRKGQEKKKARRSKAELR